MVSVVVGLLIGFVKYLFDDVIGFSLIVVFPLIYGWLIGLVLAKLFNNFKLQNQKLAIYFSILSITTAIALFFFLDFFYVQSLILDYFASQGEDITDMYLTVPGYFSTIGEIGTSVGFGGVRGIEITGIWFYGLMIVEFGLMYYYAIKNVRTQHSKLMS